MNDNRKYVLTTKLTKQYKNNVTKTKTLHRKLIPLNAKPCTESPALSLVNNAHLEHPVRCRRQMKKPGNEVVAHPESLSSGRRAAGPCRPIRNPLGRLGYPSSFYLRLLGLCINVNFTRTEFIVHGLVHMQSVKGWGSQGNRWSMGDDAPSRLFIRESLMTNGQEVSSTVYGGTPSLMTTHMFNFNMHYMTRQLVQISV